MSKRWWSYAVWAVVAGAAMWWGLRLIGREQPAETVLATAGAAAPVVSPLPVTGQNVPTPPPAAAADPVAAGRFELVRVDISPDTVSKGKSVALIGVDGLPPKAFRVGDTVVGAVVLQSVQANSASLGPADGPTAIVLQVSPPLTSSAASQAANGAGSRRAQGDSQPPVRAASAPPVNRQAVPVSDPDHGVDTSNH